MSLSLDAAVAHLARSVDVERADRRLAERLAAVRQLLADDLDAVESAVVSTACAGPEPAAAAAAHLVRRGGKRVRPLALLLSAACFGPVPAAARELAVVAELVHSATLLHDDVVDDGGERRGAPTARRLWGNGISVLAGDLLLVHALDLTLRAAPEVMPDLAATLRRLVEGEIVQLRGRSELDISERTYERVLADKTASLFSWATRTGARLAGASQSEQERLAQFGDRLGISFQLIDDVLDYVGTETGKTSLADLSEGKLTLPLVLAVAENPDLIGSLRRIHAGDRSMLDAVRRAVLESGVCGEVRRRAERYTNEAITALADVRPGPARLLLEGLARELARRAA